MGDSTVGSASTSGRRVDELEWVVDTGSPLNISPLREKMFNFRPSSMQMRGFNGASSTSAGTGDMIVHVVGADGSTNYLRINDVQFVPDADCNLLSREAMLAAGEKWERTYRAVGSEEHYFDCDSDVAFMVAESRDGKLWARVVGVGPPPAHVGGDIDGVFSTSPADGAAGQSGSANSANIPSSPSNDSGSSNGVQPSSSAGTQPCSSNIGLKPGSDGDRVNGDSTCSSSGAGLVKSRVLFFEGASASNSKSAGSSSSSSSKMDLEEMLQAYQRGDKSVAPALFEALEARAIRPVPIIERDLKPKNVLLDTLDAVQPQQLSPEQQRLRLLAERWHRRYGHLSWSGLAKLARSGSVAGMDVPAEVFEQLAREEPCETCELTKHVSKSYPATGSRATAPLDLIHTDIWQGDRPGRGGIKYMLTVLDDYSKFARVVMMKSKSDAPACLAEVIREWECQLGRKVKEVQSDRGREFLSDGMQAFFKERGIVHLTSATYTPQQNGAAERVQQTLARTARAMLEDADLAANLWCEALLTACTVRNRSPISCDSKTPFELFTGRQPSAKLMRVFGCPAYVKITGQKKPGKLAPNRSKGKFVGWERGSVAYRVLMPGGNIVVSSDVNFDERPNWWTAEARKARGAILEKFPHLLFEESDDEDERCGGECGQSPSYPTYACRWRQ